MNIEKIRSQMRKGILEYCILLILKDKEAYASEIINILQDTHLIVVEGTLYPLLTRLKNDNLLMYQWVESVQGPPRKYYRLTDEGKNFLLELENAWDEISGSVGKLKIRNLKNS